MILRRAIFAISLVVAALLAACQTTAPRDASPADAPHDPNPHAADYIELASTGDGIVYQLDPARSKVHVYVFRGGAAARAGHNHILSAPHFAGYAFAPAGSPPSKARFDLRVPLAMMTIDDPALRANTGGGFAGERSQDDIEGTQRNMLGPKGLDAERYPYLDVRSTTISGDWPILVAEVDVTIKGATHRQPVMLRVDRDDESLKVSGTMVLRHTDFGLEPYSVLGGLLAVQDALAIDFELVGTRLR